MKDLLSLIGQMTLEEKVGQLIQLNSAFFGADSELTGPAKERGLSREALSRIGSCIGGIGANKLRAIQKAHLEADRNKIPLLFMRDVIHGYRTIYPIILGMTSSFDPELLYECSKMAAKESSAGGVHLTYAPMIDLARDARWGRVMECGGEDPYLASVMGATQVRGYQGESLSDKSTVAACVKHFAAYGGGEAGREYNPADMSDRVLRDFYLRPYKACIDAGVKMLMPSFNSVNGVPSTASSYLMQDILRGEWNYNGAVISDWGAIEELVVHGVAENHKEAARLAFENGCHIEMCSATYENHLAELVREGTVSEAALDEAVLTVLKLKDELGLFEDPYRDSSAERGAAMYLSPEHRAIARRAAEESCVLLKNDGTLPFKKSVKTVAIIGPLAEEKAIQGPWSALARDEDTVSVLEGVRALLKDAEILTARGCGYLHTDTDKSGFAEAIEIAKRADAVILAVGEKFDYSGEGKSRADITLPGPQAELIRAVCEVNECSAVLLFNGRPLALTNIYDIAPAILEMWFPGSEGGNAAANILFGEKNPSGKLAMTFPRAVGQCPIYYNRTDTGRPKTVPDEVYEPFVTGYLDCGNLPLFFFGEGLSYTEFEYLDMTLDRDRMRRDEKITVTVRVKNIGERDGKEVVQLYLRDKTASVTRPVQELVAFKKVEIKAQDTATITFEITEEMLRFYNARSVEVSEAGEFTLFVGYADHPKHKKSFWLVD